MKISSLKINLLLIYLDDGFATIKKECVAIQRGEKLKLA